MNAFQLVTLPITTFFAIRSFVVLARGGRPIIGNVLFAAMWTGATAAILDPGLTNRVAGMLGIGRGADLLIYLVALGLMWGFLYFYRKYRRLSSEITTLAREMALRDAHRADTTGDGSGRV